MASYTAVAAGGDWSNNATWGGAGHPVAGDTANIDATMTATVTVDAASACAILNLTNNGGTLAFGNYVITCEGNVTLGGAITAGTGGLKVSSTSTLTSSGVTFPGTLELSGTATRTLSGNWVNTGLVTLSGAGTLNWTTNETLTCNGGATSSAVQVAGTAKLIIGGGTLQSSTAANIFCNDIDLAGNVTIGTNLAFKTKTLTWVSGTIDQTTNSSTLTISGSCTLNTPTANMHWYNITTSATSTLTLTSAITADQNLTSGSGTMTLATSDVTVGGNVTATATITGTGRTITMTGTGTTPTLSGNFGIGLISCNLTFNAPAGAITISGIVKFTTGTLTYTAIATPTVTNSTLLITAAATISTGALSLYNVIFRTVTGMTVTLGTDLVMSNNLTFDTALTTTIAGAYNFSCANLYAYPSTVYVGVVKLLHAQTLTVSNSMNIAGNGNYSLTIKSDSAASTFLNYGGTAANCKVFNTIFTWVDASGSAQEIWNWFGGTLSNTVNIANKTDADIGGGGGFVGIISG